LLIFSFTVVGTGGVTLTAADVLQAQVQASIIGGFSSVLGLPTATIRIINVTDIASGAVTRVSRRRQLQPAAAPGSLGLSITLAANLGKVPSQAFAQGLLAALQGSNATSALTATTAALAAFRRVPAATFTAQSGPVSIANAPFSISQQIGAAVAGGGGSSGGSAAVGGGVAAGCVALGLALWMGDSKRLTGKLPCYRDFGAEASEKARLRAEARAVSEEIKRLEVENPINGPRSSSSSGGALVIRNLGASNKKLADEAAAKAAEAERASAQLEKFKAQVAAQVQSSVADKGVTLAATAKAPRRDFSPSGLK